MTDELARFHLEPDDGYAGAVTLDRTAVGRVSVALQRTRSAVVRRGPRRAITGSVPLHNAYALTWDMEASNDLPTMRTILEALCDAQSALIVPGGHEWTLNASDKGARTFSSWTATEDGLSHRLRGGICKEVSLSINTGSIAAIASTWEFLTCEEVVEETADTTSSADRWAGGVDCHASWGGQDLTAWAVALNFSRDMSVGDIDDVGVARGYTGRPAVDIAGRLVGRISGEDAAELFRSDSTRELKISLYAGSAKMVITLHRVTFMITARRVVGNGQIEHTIEFVATAGTGLPTATVSLVQS